MKRKFSFLLLTATALDVSALLFAPASALMGQVTIIEEAKLIPADGLPSEGFGFAVALSGDTALIAGRDQTNRGVVYVFDRSGSTWTRSTLLTSDGAPDDAFGYAVALSGDTALIGAYVDDSSRGTAYVFVRSGGKWTRQAKLLVSDGVAGDNFGGSVALIGDRALIGATGDDGRGAAYLFVRSGSTWTQQAKLVSFDSAPGDLFGISVALSGDTALIGASGDEVYRGSAYVFVRSGGGWTLQAKLVGDPNPGEFAVFGDKVALLGDIALAGGFAAFGNTGSAYVFLRKGNTWTRVRQLSAPGFYTLGTSMAIGPRLAMVGAPASDDSRGGAFVFFRDENKNMRLVGSDGFGCGWAVALSGDTALVSCTGGVQPAVYVFRALP